MYVFVKICSFSGEKVNNGLLNRENSDHFNV